MHNPVPPVTGRPIGSVPPATPGEISVSDDWITNFMTFTEGLPTPEIFRLWSGISTIAATLERRVWVATGRGVIYPNLFVVLVAPPAVGKSVAIDQSIRAIQTATGLVAKEYTQGKLNLAPIDLTPASLIDVLSASSRRAPVNNGTDLIEYSSLYVAIGELGVLMPGHDLHMISILNYLYDNPTHYSQQRRSLGKDAITITNPGLNILSGTQPAFLASTLPEEAWGMGFASRLLLIYASSGPLVDLFDSGEQDPKMFQALVKGLSRMYANYGLIRWEEDAMKEMKHLHATGIPPVPDHSRLQHYVGRRSLQLIKLAMVSCCSRGHHTISVSDVHRARMWLLGAEALMPDIFRDMVGKSDGQVIQELHLFLWKLWAKDRKPIHEARLFDFLRSRVPSEKVQKIIEIAERSDIIVRQAGSSLYTPRPKHEHGME